MRKRWNVIFAAMLVLASMTALGGPALADDDDDGDNNLVVDDNAAECHDAGYATIQAAVDAAAAMPGDDEVHVCEGTYPEDVTIGPNNPLDLEGDGTGETVVTGVPGSSNPIIHVDNAGEVDIADLTIDGQSDRSGGATYGILYTAADGDVSSVEVLNIRNASGTTQGVGIAYRGSSGPARGSVQDSHIENFTRVGIFANGLEARVDIEENLLIGQVAPKVWAANGIQISRGAEADIEENEVRNANSGNPPGGRATAIYLFCAGPTSVEDNRVVDSDVGVGLSDNQGAVVTDNTVENSVFDAYHLEFLGNRFGDLGCPGGQSPPSDNLLEDNTATNSGEDGIGLSSFSDADNPPQPPTNNVIRDNEIENSGRDGVHVSSGMDNLFEDNEIEGSANLSCNDMSTGDGTAGTANEWDDNEGEQPSNPSGICGGDDAGDDGDDGDNEEDNGDEGEEDDEDEDDDDEDDEDEDD